VDTRRTFPNSLGSCPELLVTENSPDEGGCLLTVDNQRNQAVPGMTEILCVEAEVPGEERGELDFVETTENLRIPDSLVGEIHTDLPRSDPRGVK
jgi:hypothetical protein